jgi:hypothetical protein
VSDMEVMRTEQNSLGLLETLSDKLWGNLKQPNGNVGHPRPRRLRVRDFREP